MTPLKAFLPYGAQYVCAFGDLRLILTADIPPLASRNHIVDVNQAVDSTELKLSGSGLHAERLPWDILNSHFNL